MSPAKPLPTPNPPPTRRPISPTPPPQFRTSFLHHFVASSIHSSALPQDRAPLFSTPYTLFSIHNSAHPFSFVNTAHSLPKTPGGSIGLANQIFSDRRPSKDYPVTPLGSALPQTQTSLPATPIESAPFFTVVHIFAKSTPVTPASTTLTKHTPRNPIRMNTSAKHLEPPKPHCTLTNSYQTTCLTELACDDRFPRAKRHDGRELPAPGRNSRRRRREALTQRRPHAFVVGAAAAFGNDPVDDLVGVGDVAGFAVHAVGGVDFQFCAGGIFSDFVDRGGAEILAGVAVLDDAFGRADVQIADQEMRWLVVVVARAGVVDVGEAIKGQRAVAFKTLGHSSRGFFLNFFRAEFFVVGVARV